MLEHHWKTHHKTKPEPKPDPYPADQEMPECRYINSETGESDWKPIIPIISGVYPPNHPAADHPW